MPTGRHEEMAQAKKILIYLFIVFALYTIITSPDRAGDLVRMAFQGISTAANGLGDFMTQIVN
ncbi:hypothetical protein [Streptomyces sp. TP-A0874]|uniref:hypothetical protein n=1 Tax=Streptomyces sp. TP-A0874 TaxID=549819 RepID=UPI001112E004|nr:hypothetical protein [Streptomyces sp. TP-A0874]